MNFPPAFPHQTLTQIGDDLFMVRGSFQLNRFVRISRNMAIVRSGDELTLVNPIRLDEGGLRDLDTLGTVRHIVRLGAAHGSDDPFYVGRYKPVFWCQEGGERYREPPIDRVLSEGGELPFGGAQLTCFRTAKYPECALVLTKDRGILLTCDSIQHWGDYSNSSPLARLIMPFVGFPKTTLVGPFWLKRVTQPGVSLRADFQRLLKLDFDIVLGAHGTLLEAGAHAAVERAVAKAFPN
jgi:hypothetical protein